MPKIGEGELWVEGIKISGRIKINILPLLLVAELADKDSYECGLALGVQFLSYLSALVDFSFISINVVFSWGKSVFSVQVDLAFALIGEMLY